VSTIVFRFDLEKATQTAAKFLKFAGGRISYMKLIKLMYLADREAIFQLEQSISGDHYYSLKNGPILSRVKDLITEEDQQESYWSHHISAPQSYDVMLLNDPGDEALSEAEDEIIQTTFKTYGSIDKFTLADLTHEICGEWKAPSETGPKATPITIESILKELGKEADIPRIANEVEQQRVLGILLK